MAGKSASLLTKTQRNRIRNDFTELDEQQKHRDQQRIRERVRSGFLDFQLLADYPDHQLRLMFDDVSDDELRAALADITILVERLCEQSEIDREELVEEVRNHIVEYSDVTGDTKTLEQVDLRTVAEIQQQTEDDLAEQFGAGRWDKRANGLLKLGIVSFTLTVFGQFLYRPTMSTIFQSILHPVLGWIIVILFVCAAGWILINTAQLLKYSIVPFLVELSDNPKAVIHAIFTKLVRNPQETLRESWDEL